MEPTEVVGAHDRQGQVLPFAVCPRLQAGAACADQIICAYPVLVDHLDCQQVGPQVSANGGSAVITSANAALLQIVCY